MTRFITLELYSGEILVFEEHEAWEEALHRDDVADWIWHFADSKQEAVANHAKKHDEFTGDINAGLEAKRTY